MEPSQRNKQDWEQDDPMFQSWGTRVPTNVGKRGKAKEMMRLGAQQRRDDDDDFFARMNKSNSKQPPTGPKKTNNPPAQPKKMSISFRPDSSVPSLLDRMSDGPSRHNDRDRHRNRDRDRDWDRDKRRDRDRDRDRDRGHRRREDTGPRYHGGYS
ncbi:hypothetical protein VKT23_002085 [Stygiomarasmius scandens]|uniref:Uncharacterized protein n=1 Tax=Marasmiellus scandens TaxID=2682957 RepID=A0ABR1K1C2_9AGAR